jgi:predicted transport protein
MDQAAQSMIANLEKNSGKSLEAWIGIVKSSGLSKHGEILKLLKETHGLTHGYANLVAHKAKGSDAGSATDLGELVAEQYKGKEALKPIYDRLLAEIKKFGNDVEIAPKKAYVSIRRKKQFAMLTPATKTRFEIGINLKSAGAAGKLEKITTANSMCSHRIKLESAEEIDSETIEWLKAAYTEAG